MTDEDYVASVSRKYLHDARLNDPWGFYCGGCSETNLNVDDVGWFVPIANVALCERCWASGNHTTCER